MVEIERSQDGVVNLERMELSQRHEVGYPNRPGLRRVAHALDCKWMLVDKVEPARLAHHSGSKGLPGRLQSEASQDPQPFPGQVENGDSLAGFSQTETCWVLSLVNGSRVQPSQRSRSVMPASRAIRSSSDGHT